MTRFRKIRSDLPVVQSHSASHSDALPSSVSCLPHCVACLPASSAPARVRSLAIFRRPSCPSFNRFNVEPRRCFSDVQSWAGETEVSHDEASNDHQFRSRRSAGGRRNSRHLATAAIKEPSRRIRRYHVTQRIEGRREQACDGRLRRPIVCLFSEASLAACSAAPRRLRGTASLKCARRDPVHSAIASAGSINAWG